VILSSPQSLTVSNASPVSLFASAGGSPSAVQWYLGGNAIAGATSTNLGFVASGLQAGVYTAAFSNFAGTATSQAAILSVVAAGPFTNGGFEIGTQDIPINNGITVSPDATWLTGWVVGSVPGPAVNVNSGTSDGLSPYEGQHWIVFDPNRQSGGSLSQTFTTALGSTYWVTFATAAASSNGAGISAAAIASDGTILASNLYTPSVAAWTVEQLTFTATGASSTVAFMPEVYNVALDNVAIVGWPTNGPPVIVTNPATQTVAAGMPATFTSFAGGGPSTAQWFFGSNAIPNATNLTLTVTATDSTSGNYFAVFGNTNGTATSTVAVLTAVYPPAILFSPTNQSVVAGSLVTLSSAASGSPATVQWLKNGSPVPAGTNDVLTLIAGTGDAGAYTALFSNLAGMATTSVASLNVIPGPFFNGGFELINLPPIPPGSGVALASGATWLAGWVAGGPGGDIAVNNGFSDGLNPYEGNQWVVFNGGDSPPGGSLSQTFATTISQVYLVSFAVGQAGSGSVSLAASVIAADGTLLANNRFDPASNVWTQFQLGFTARTTNTTLTFTDVSSQTDGVDLALDDVMVTAINPPVLVSSPQSQTVNAGAEVVLSASISGGPASVQWYHGTSALMSGTNGTLALTASVGAAGTYTAVFSNAAGVVTSGAALLSVTPGPFTNGGFETVSGGPISPGTGQLLNLGDTWLVGWTVGGPGGDIDVENGANEGLNPYEGEQWVVFNASDTPPGGVVSQTFVTTTGTTYNATFVVGQAGVGNVSLTATVLGIDDSVLAAQLCISSPGLWTPFQLEFTAVSTNTTIVFTDTSLDTIGVDVALDDVAVAQSGSNFASLGIGSTAVQSGQFAFVPVSLSSTAALTNLTFTLVYPASRFTNWTLAASNAAIGQTSVQGLNLSETEFNLAAASGQTFKDSSLLGAIGTTTLPGPSLVALLQLTNIVATASNGAIISNVLGQPGQIIVVGTQPILQGPLGANGAFTLAVYGNPGSSYEISYTTNLDDSSPWIPLERIALTNLFQAIALPIATNQMEFFRATQQ
jgi:hypothetical protein